MRWKELFEPCILDRGWMYWQMGSVRSLEADGDSIRAKVEGSEKYEVRINLRGDEVAAMSCTCPFAESGENCKHMAAALFAWSEEEKEARPEEAASGVEALRALVASADEATVRGFLTEALLRDYKLRARFERLLDPKRAGEALEAARSRVDDVVELYMEDGFIDYLDVSSFMEEMREALDEEVDSLRELNCPRDAFEFVAYVLEALDGVDMDDSDGERLELMDDCQACIEAILDDASKEDERYIFDRMFRFRGGDCAGDVFKVLLEERFEEPDYQQLKLQRERQELARLAEGDPKNGFAHAEMERRALRCLELMAETGAAQSEIEALRREYWRFPLVRGGRMDELEREKRWAELAEVVRESIALDERTYPGYLPNYHRRLKDACRELGDGEAYRAELWALVTRWMPGDLDCFREYRAIFPAEDWPAERERLLAALPPRADPGELLVEEKLYDRLRERAVSEPGLHMLRRYEEYLAGRYPDQVLRKYARELDSAARRAADRNTYHHWAVMLRHMRSLHGGEEVVRVLVAGWRERYPRRTAMLDELREF